MAKKVTKKPAASPRRGAAKKSAPSRKPTAAKRSSSAAKKQPRPRAQKPQSISASDALVGLLESPLVADVLAAGAAAALASFTHHRLTRRHDGNSKQALKDAAKAAATAMGSRLHDEFDEILENSKKAKRAKA